MALTQSPGPGTVVEFMHGNKPQVAWVLEEQSGKLRLLTINKRESKLAAARLLPWAGPVGNAGASREEIIQTLEACQARREAYQAEVDAMELWELSQGEVESASVAWFAELIWQEPDADRLAAMGRAILACKTHFKFSPPNFIIHPADKVEARLAEEAVAHERERIASAGASFFKELWEACRKNAPVPAAQPEDEIADKLREALYTRMADPQATDPLWKQLAAGLPDDPHLPLRLAAKWGVAPVHYNFLLDQAGFAAGDGWSEAHAEGIAAAREAVAGDEAELSDLGFVSIDSETTRDVDDAFFVERAGSGWRLTLALACPDVGWEFGSALDRAVFARATSIYLPEGTCHMMPETLGTDLYSLRADGPRPAALVAMDIDESGEVTGCEITRRRVRIAANLAYAQVEAWLEGGGENGHTSMLAEAHALSEKLRDARLARGAVIIEREEPDLVLEPAEGESVFDAGVNVRMVEKPETPKSQLLVSEFMILANSAVADWAAERGVALLHRTQNIGLPKEHSGVWREPHEIFQIIKSLGSSILEINPRPHASLGVARYAPVSSPIRRYPDLINMAQLVHYCAAGAPRWTEEDLKEMLPSLSAHLDAAGRVQRFRPRYWKLLYFKQQGAKKAWPALVVDADQALVTVSLPREQIFVRGPRRFFGDKVHPGQRFQVRLGKVDPLYNDILILEAWEE